MPLAWTLLAAAGERYAVLVGVNNYPNLERQDQLQGPANDVSLMQSVLRARGFSDEHMLVLADGLPGAAAPTRAGILQALVAITSRAQRGDFLYLHFSGHGSQQPENAERTDRGHKPDGMNEIFLPRDVAFWSEADASIRNVIVDFEMNAAVTALRNKGVFVWVVFDSCHSASMARGTALEDVSFRQVDPARLGVPEAAMTRALRRASTADDAPGDDLPVSPLGPPVDLKSDAAGFVAFYAAQTSETAPEMPLPLEATDHRRQGLFSFMLARAIAENGRITYRQLRDYVLQQYAAMGFFATTPLMEGTELDAPIFGDAGARKIQQWPIARTDGQLKIPAGAIQDLSAGALFAVLTNPLASDADAIGYLEASSVDVFETQLVPTQERLGGIEPTAELHSEAVPKGAYARLLQSVPNFTLKVALPPRSPLESRDQARLRKVLTSLQAASSAGARVKWVPPGQPADLRLSFGPLDALKPTATAGELWLLPPTGELRATGPRRSLSIHLAQGDAALAAKLRESLQRISRYLNLLRVCAQMPADTASGADLEVQVMVTRAGSNQAQPLSEGPLPRLYTDDIVEFRLLNRGPKAVDVTLLFLDSQYGITAMYPQAGRLNRLEAGGSDTARIQIDADTLGIERMLVISVAAEANQPNADFSFLQQQALATKRGSGGSLQALFEEAVFGGVGTRGLVRVADTQNARMRLISWQTAMH